MDESTGLDYFTLGYQGETPISRTGSRTLNIRGIPLALQENLLYPTPDHNKDHPFIDSWVMGLEENISVVVKDGGAYHQLKDIDTRRRVVNWGL